MAIRPSSSHYLPFEGALKDFDDRIRKLEDLCKQNNVDLTSEIERQIALRDLALKEMCGKLTAWDRIQMARHVLRPQTADYVEMMCEDFIELHGDRSFADDRAILSGLAQVDGVRFMLVGQHKGRDVHERSICNFGSPQPEGFRKALLKMRLAEKLKLPIVCLIDTKGAAPDIGAADGTLIFPSSGESNTMPADVCSAMPRSRLMVPTKLAMKRLTGRS